MKKWIAAIAYLLWVQNIYAQVLINEGRITYDMYIGNDAENPKGQLIITIKNNIMKREMLMNNGFTNMIMFDATTGLSKMYNEVNGNKLVKNMSKDEVLSQNAKFENAKYDYKTAAKQIANKDCKQVNITYTDGTSNIVFITEDYKVSLKEFYTMFAELKGFPMQYEVATSGSKILLVAKSVEQIPIDAKDLEAPKGYKVVKY